MAARLNRPSGKVVEELLLHTPSPPPMSATFPPMSRSTSYSSQEIKRLVVNGQLVNVVLPGIVPDMSTWIEDIVSAVRSMQEYEDEDIYLCVSKEVFPIDENGYKDQKPKICFPDLQDWNEYINAVREAEILNLGIVRVTPIPRQISPTIPTPFIHPANPVYQGTISPVTGIISPMMPYSPMFPQPVGLHPQIQHFAFTQPISPPLATPADWTWRGLGITTPSHLVTQPQDPSWSVMAVKSTSPISLPTGLSPIPNSDASPPTTKKRSFSTDNPSASNPQSSQNDLPDAKKQHSSPPTIAPTPRRGPFPFAIPKPNDNPQTSSQHTHKPSTSLNPFATEFVFRAPQLPAPKPSASQTKEFSPVNLQQSSKSLFNVFAPEFNPSKTVSNFLGNAPSLFPKKSTTVDAVFIKPSPTKKPVPIRKPENEEQEDMGTQDKEDEIESSHGVASRPESDDDIKGPTKRVRKQSILDEDSPSDHREEEHATPTESPAKKQEYQASQRYASTPLPSDTRPESILEESKSRHSSRIRRVHIRRSGTPTPRRPRMRDSSEASTELDEESNSSAEREFNGYPSFWEHRFHKANRKYQEDEEVFPSIDGSDKEEEEDDEEDEESEKENRILMDEEEESSDSEDPINVGLKLYTQAKMQSERNVERTLTKEIEPILKALMTLQFGLAELINIKGEERMKEDKGNEADDEDEELPPVKSRGNGLSQERIRDPVVEALRQEKGLFVSTPVIDTSAVDAERKELKAVVDGLKSKLLDAEDTLNRELQKRTELERQVEILSRDQSQTAKHLDLKSEQLKQYEQDNRELQKNYDDAKRECNDERQNREKLDEVIKGIRSSLGQMTDKNSKLTQELTSLHSLTTSQKEEISSLRQDLSKSRGENGNLAKEKLKLKRDLQDQNGRFTNLQNELMETGKAVAEQETRWREELSAEKLRVQSLERSLADEERRVKKMEEECDKLGKIAEERGKLKAMVEAAVSRERVLETAKETLERRVYAAEAKVNVMEQERAKSQNEKISRSEKESWNAEINTLRKNVSKMQEEKSQAAVQYEKEKGKVASQSERIHALEQQIRHLTEKLIEREKIADSAARDAKESQSQSVALRAEVSGLRDRLDKKEAAMETLRNVNQQARTEIAEKDKLILQLEFIIASTTSPTKKFGEEDVNLKLQRRDKEILRLRELMSALLHDNEDLIQQSKENLAPEQQKKYNAMKNILRAERERRKGLERELAKAMAKEKREELGQTPGSKSVMSGTFDTPSSLAGVLDTPVSLKDTPRSLRGISLGGVEDTPLKQKSVILE